MFVCGGAGSGKTANTIEPAVISSIIQGHSIALFDYKFDNNGLAENLMAVAIDYGYQRWQFERSIKMTKQEIKEESKQQEGNPEIKNRQRRLQRQMAMRRMMTTSLRVRR